MGFIVTTRDKVIVLRYFCTPIALPVRRPEPASIFLFQDDTWDHNLRLLVGSGLLVGFYHKPSRKAWQS